MKVHFVIPPAKKPVDRIYGCNYSLFPQHNVILLSIVTFIRGNGMSVQITNCPVDGIDRIEDLDDSGDVYVLYSVGLSQRLDLETAKTLRAKYRKPIVFMGPYPTWTPESYLLDEGYYVVRGEPEYSLLELLEVLERDDSVDRVKGVSWRQDREIIHNHFRGHVENLDSLPIPDRNLLKNPLKYFHPQFKRSPQTTLMASRGCAYRCYYCVPNSLSYARELESRKYTGKKPPVTLRSAESVIEELEVLHKLGYKGVKFIDDQFLWGRERTLHICDALKRFDFETICLARADRLQDKEVVRALAEANVTSIDLGIESFDPRILDYIKKDIDPCIYDEVIANLRAFGIEPELNILLGSCSLETKETIEETWKRAKRFDVDIIHVKVCAAYPGTEFYNEALEHGWITTEDYIPHDASKETYTSYPHLPQEYLQKTVKRMYREHYFSPRYFMKQLKNIKSFTELMNKARAAWGILTR